MKKEESIFSVKEIYFKENIKQLLIKSLQTELYNFIVCNIIDNDTKEYLFSILKVDIQLNEKEYTLSYNTFKEFTESLKLVAKTIYPDNKYKVKKYRKKFYKGLTKIFFSDNDNYLEKEVILSANFF